MKLFFIIPICLLTFSTTAQNITTHIVEPSGIYKGINQKRELAVIKSLTDNDTNKTELINSIENEANTYAPPVLYYLSMVLFNSDKKDECAYWYYVAQLRARYDVNRCTDKTANATEYNQMFGESINPYAIKDLNKFEEIIKKAIIFVSTNKEQYDQRWINLSGMDAIQASLGNKKENKTLSIAENKWPEIKAKTIKDYKAGFDEAILMLKSKKQ